MKILNLYAGLGGNRKNWGSHEVTAVEYNPQIAAVYQEQYPDDKILVKDVVTWIRKCDLSQYDFIWASPPCTTHSCATSFHLRYVPDLTQIYGLIIHLEYKIGTAGYKNKKPQALYCIENVQPFYGLKKWFGPGLLPTVKLDRHYFWSNFPIPEPIEELTNSRLSLDYLNTNKHQRSLLMRGQVEDMAKYHGFNLTLLDGYKGRKDKVVRNMMHHTIADYILSCAVLHDSNGTQDLTRYFNAKER
jgi:DNA (cytosine-5)-methyltransferase 1